MQEEVTKRGNLTHVRYEVIHIDHKKDIRDPATTNLVQNI